MQELTYGSADGIAGRQAQGWGVLRRAGDSDPAVEASLLDGVSVSMPVTVAKFPSAADLAGRPVRFRFASSKDGMLGRWWRSVEAGSDHSQRPGNVFTHAVAGPVAADTRPADLALSPHWLSPYGADQVRDALPSGELALPPDPNDRGVGAVLRWLHGSRGVVVPAASWVVDVAMHSLTANSMVVLRGVSSEDAWGWIALITWLLPNATGSTVAFSTGEDLTSFGKAVDLGARVVAVTGDGPLPSTGRPVCELDPRWGVDAGAATTAGSWMLPNGMTFPVTPWATVVRDLIWLDPSSARLTLRHREEVFGPLVDSGLPHADASSLAVRLGLLATPGAVIMGRDDMLTSTLALDVLPVHLRSHPLIEPLLAEAGLPPVHVPRDGMPLNGDLTERIRPQEPGGPSQRDDLGGSVDAGTLTLPPETVHPSEPSGSARGTTAGPARRARTDGAAEIEVRLAKNTPVPLSQADLLDDFLYPTPASLLPAVTMVAHYCSLDDIGDPQRWVPLMLELPPLGRLALLHCISQAAPTALADQNVSRLMTAFRQGLKFDRYIRPLLLLLLRAEAAQGDALIMSRDRPLWHRDLADFVSKLEPYEAGYLAVPFLELISRFDTTAAGHARREARKVINKWAKDPPPTVLWSLPCADGRPLARVVADSLGARVTVPVTDPWGDDEISPEVRKTLDSPDPRSD